MELQVLKKKKTRKVKQALPTRTDTERENIDNGPGKESFRDFISQIESDMGNQKQSVDTEIILWPTLTDSVLEKSEFGSIAFTHDEGNIRLAESSSPAKVTAIKEDELERLGALELAEKHAETYAKFSNYVQKVKDSDFYQRLLEYKKYYFEGQIINLKLEILKDSCRDLAGKCWSFVTKQAQFDQECGDGRLLTCFTTIDSAEFNQHKASELIKKNNQTLEMTADFVFNDYRTNVAKLYIQNYLDVFLQEFVEMLLSYSTFRDKMEHWDNFQIIVAVLFEFLRIENSDKDLSQNNAFIKDCKTWVTHVITCLNASFSFLDSRIILLHALRTKGIGNWGLIFIQWNESYDWNEDVLEHYLISLTCLLSPVEELELRIKSKLEAIAYLEEELKKLEGEDWIVVYDDDLPEEAALKRSNSRMNLTSIILLERDYLGIFSQFRLKQVFETLCFKYSQESDKSPLHLISIAHHICLIIIRGIHVIPKDFLELIRHLGDHISFIANTLAECLRHFIDNGADILGSDHIQSSVSLELDVFMERLFLRLSGIKGKPVWETLSALPFSKCTVSGKKRISELFVSFFRADEKKVDSDVVYICAMVRGLILSDSRPNPNSAPNSFMDYDSFRPELLRSIYHLTFVNHDTRPHFSKYGPACIHDISSHKPEMMSYILNWIRDDIHLLHIAEINELCCKLPWIKFRAKKSDLLLLQGMLRDQEKNLKAQIAMLVLESLNWGYSTDGNLGLFIPRYLHREMGIMVINLYLDRMDHFEADSIISSVSATVEKSFQNSLGVRTRGEEKFVDWIWRFIVKLKLYQKPSATDIYPADSLGTFSKPYLALEATALLSLRSSMNSEPLSAYMLLMISNIGHHFHQFRAHSLSLLSVLYSKAKYDAIFLVFCEVLPSFALDADFCEDRRFLQLVNSLFSTNYSSESFSDMRQIFFEYIQVLSKSEKDEIVSAVDFWHELIFSIQNNISSELGMLILDNISRMCFELGISPECQRSLASILKEKIAEYNATIEKETISIKNPVASVYSLKTYFTRKYPDIVPSIEFKCKYSDSRAWFAIDGYLAEVLVSSSERKLVGSQLYAKGTLDDNEIRRRNPASYTICRLAKEFQILKPNHSLAPIYLNLFLSLYYESTSPAQIFGHLTLMDSKKASVDIIINFIKKSVINLDEMGKEENNDLRNLYNSFLLWLNDPQLLLDGLYSSTVSEDYLPQRFEFCIKGDILKSGSCSWNDLLLPLTFDHNTGSDLNLDSDLLQVRYLQLASLPAPKVIPVFPLQTPLFGKTNMTLDIISSKIAVDLNILSDKADQFSSINSNLQKLELEYIEKLKLLYSSSSIRNRTQKTCGKECKSPAMFDYITYKIMAVSEVKLMLLDNRSTKDSYLNHELADSKICVLGLEINLIMEWLQKQSSNDLDHSVGSNLFFAILEAIFQNENLGLFNISNFVLKKILASLGHAFISTSLENNLKLWKMMSKPRVVEMTGSIFSPSFAPEHFNFLYMDLCSRFEILGDDMTDLIINNFHVVKWLEQVVSNDQMFEFFITLIAWPVTVEQGPKSFVSNRKLLRDLLSHQSFRPMIPDAVGLCFSKMLLKPFSVIIFSDVANSLFVLVPKNWQSSLENLDLLESHFSREQLTMLMGYLNTTLKDFITVNGKSVINLDRDIQNGIIRLFALLVCSKQLYSMIINLYFEELYSIWLSIYVGVIGLVADNNSWKYLVTFKQKNYENNREIVENLNRILEKFCRNSSHIAKIPHSYWEIITMILELNLPDALVECILSTYECSSFWEHFSLTPHVITSFKIWIVEKKMSQSLIMCIFRILECSSIEESILIPPNMEDLLFVIVYVVNQTQSIFPELNDRIRILSVIETKYSSLSWPDSISASAFAALVDQFALFKWNTSSSQLVEWKSDGDPLVFIVKFLQSVCGILKGVCTSSYYAAYKQFILSLLSKHIFSRDSWNEAFLDEDISKIIVSFLKEAEEFKMNGICEGTDFAFFGFKDAIGIFNRMSKNHDLYVKVWNGFMKVISVSKIPLEYLACSSFSFSSVECMSLFNEKCIDRFLEIQHGPLDWKIVSKALVVPQLSMEQYVKCCLDNALLLQLFIYALQELHNSVQVESKLLIGEQVASWLKLFKPENLDFGKEGKVAPLLYLFSILLSIEMSQNAVVSHSRLQSMVPNIANSLIKLSEDRVSGGLWSTIGFGPKSKYALNFRFFCRIIGAFMASRVLPTQERTKLVESVESLHSNPEYESLLLYLDPIMDDYLLSNVDLSALSDLIKHETMALFELYFVGSLEI